MITKPELFYGTCVALGADAVILTGPSGSGKSDLALRFIYQTPPELEPALVADDQIYVEARDGRVIAAPPPAIAGRIEVRGLGILDVPHRGEAEIKFIIHLTGGDHVPRLPPARLAQQTVCGIPVPVLVLSPFDASTPIKLRLALQRPIW